MKPLSAGQVIAGLSLLALLSVCQKPSETGGAGGTKPHQAGSDAAAPVVNFLEWSGEIEPAVVVHQIEIGAASAQWVITADQHRLVPGDDEKTPWQLLLRSSDIRMVEIPLPDDLGPFNRIEVEYNSGGDVDVQAVVACQGKNIFRSEWTRRRLLRDAVRVAEFKPYTCAEPRAGQVLRFRFRGGRPDITLCRGRILNSSVAAAISPEMAESRSFEVDGQARNSVGLAGGNPITAKASDPGAAELRFDVHVLDGLRQATANVDLEIECWRGDELQADQSIPLPELTAELWVPVAFSLPATTRAGDQIRLSLKGTEGKFWWGCAIGGARLVRAGQRPRNVLFVTSDTHRADHLGCSRSGVEIKTPVLDALAESGVYFEDCYSAINNTNPSHIAMMTGIHPRDTGIVDNATSLAEHATTLAEVFRQHGYVTLASVSARHLGETSGLRQGFTRFSFPKGVRDGGDTVTIVKQWVESLEDEPLFVWTHVFDAHTPYEPPPEYGSQYWDYSVDAFDPKLPDLPEEQVPKDLPGMKDIRFPVAMYRGEISYLDAELGRLFAARPLKDAFIAVTADHGEAHGAHGHFWGHAMLYPATIHVPLILAGPGIPAGERRDRAVQQIDVGRTLLDLAGIEALRFPGDNLLEGVEGKPRFMMEAHRFGASVQVGSWYLIFGLRDRVRYEGESERHQAQLFNIEEDPDCQNDVADQYPQVTSSMRKMILDWLADTRSFGWAEETELSKERLDELAALGYTHQSEEEGGGLLWDCQCEQCQKFSD